MKELKKENETLLGQLSEVKSNMKNKNLILMRSYKRILSILWKYMIFCLMRLCILTKKGRKSEVYLD